MSAAPGPAIVVSGYASVDYALRLAPFEGPNATTVVRSRAEVWPRYGGIAHVTRAVARAAGPGARVTAISWVGPDPEGAAWSASVRAGGALTDGVTVLGSRSPSSHLLYPEGSGTICLFDPADCHPERLSPAQRAAAAAADVAVVTVGPAAATRELVDALRSDTALFWIVKHDPSSLPDGLAARLAERARLVTLSHEESGYLDTIARAARPGAYVARTRGSDGAELLRLGDGGRFETVGTVPTEAVRGIDTTGAGDTFAGVLAVRLAAAGDPSPQQMLGFVGEAASAATAMLTARADAAPGDDTPQEKE